MRYANFSMKSFLEAISYELYYLLIAVVKDNQHDFPTVLRIGLSFMPAGCAHENSAKTPQSPGDSNQMLCAKMHGVSKASVQWTLNYEQQEIDYPPLPNFSSESLMGLHSYCANN